MIVFVQYSTNYLSLDKLPQKKEQKKKKALEGIPPPAQASMQQMLSLLSRKK